jgi:ABC-2 type transport system ATP-binding protein
MPTEGYFFPYMNCLDAGNYYKDFFNDFEVDKYMYLLDKMELDPKQKIRTMSSGMLAKMKIAITMARNADLIMLDEPFNGIDLIARDKVMETVIQSISEDMTVIISSHLVDELEKIVDTAVFMKDGRLVTTIDAESARMEENESLQDAYRRIYTEEENR